MTDNEIIKALECCSNYNDCDNCDFEPKDNKKKTVGCCLEIMKEALDLINRLQAENKRLTNNKCEDCAGCTQWLCDCSNERAQAIKEFVERLKEKQQTFTGDEYIYKFIYLIEIDNLVKEMVDEDK